MRGAALYLEKTWGRRGPLSFFLLPLSWLFGAAAGIRRRFYGWGVLRVETLPVPVIVVGNLRVGGTGKTPLVIALVGQLRAAGFRPGVISRGYGGNYARLLGPSALVERDDAGLFGDEIVLVWRRCQMPAAVGSSRVQAAHRLLLAHPQVDVIISDDGLQHYGMGRALELVVIDERGMGNGRLLPAGPLRESKARLTTVHAIVYNGTSPAMVAKAGAPHCYIMRIVPGPVYQLSQPAQIRSLESFASHHLLAAAGIGHPPRFFNMLRQAGLSFTELSLPDHFDYRTAPFGEHFEFILITEKDAVKCSHLSDARIWVVPIDARLGADFETFIVESLRGFN